MLSLVHRTPTTSSPFPYTTLFRSHFSAVSEVLVTLLVRPSPLTTRASIFTDAPESRFSVWVYGAFEASFQEPPSVRYCRVFPPPPPSEPSALMVKETGQVVPSVHSLLLDLICGLDGLVYGVIEFEASDIALSPPLKRFLACTVKV